MAGGKRSAGDFNLCSNLWAARRGGPSLPRLNQGSLSCCRLFSAWVRFPGSLDVRARHQREEPLSPPSTWAARHSVCSPPPCQIQLSVCGLPLADWGFASGGAVAPSGATGIADAADALPASSALGRARTRADVYCQRRRTYVRRVRHVRRRWWRPGATGRAGAHQHARLVGVSFTLSCEGPPWDRYAHQRVEGLFIFLVLACITLFLSLFATGCTG